MGLVSTFIRPTSDAVGNGLSSGAMLSSMQSFAGSVGCSGVLRKIAAVGRGGGFELDVELVVGELAGGHEPALLAGADADFAVFDFPVGVARGLPAEEGFAVEER